MRGDGGERSSLYVTLTSTWTVPGLTDGPTERLSAQVTGPAHRVGPPDPPEVRGWVVDVLRPLVGLIVQAGGRGVLVVRTGEDRRGRDYEGGAEHHAGQAGLSCVPDTSGGGMSCPTSRD